MRKHERLFAVLSALIFCAFLGGCVQGFGSHRRASFPVVEDSAADRPSPGNDDAPGDAAGVRFASYEEDGSIPKGAPAKLLKRASQLLDAPMPEEVPLPQGAPSETSSDAVAPAYTVQSPKTSGGERLITMHVDNLDVRKALEILSRQANMSILVSPGVSGNVTLDLRDKAADEILQAIAKLCRLKIQREDDLIFVSALSEMPEGEDGKLPVRVYHLNYVRSGDVELMITPLLSPRGTISRSPDSEVGIKSDEEKAGGNAMAGGEIVIVQDYENVLKSIDRVIAQIDVQPYQVLIEAVIVNVTLKKEMELGVNYALLDGAQNALGLVGSGSAVNAAAGFPPAGVITAAGKLAGGVGSGFAADTNGLKFGFVADNTTGFLKALETLGETKVLACPRLLVVNKQRAEIQLGDRLGYKTLTQTQTSTVEKVEFMDVGTLLRLRPFITSDGVVRMEIHPERASGQIDSNQVPQTNSAQVTSNVMVPDGMTMVIGGLMDHEVNMKYDGIPFISRLPWIGAFFRRTNPNRTKKELIIILTPHIWRPEAPGMYNNLGKPRSLGLDSRVSTLPKATGEDPPSLFAIPPDALPSDVTPPPKTRVGQLKPKRQTPSDFYALPRPLPGRAVDPIPPEGDLIPDAPWPDSPSPDDAETEHSPR